MEPLLSPNGVPYLPNEGEGLPAPPPQQFSMAVYVSVFTSIFVALQMLWDGLRNTAAERVLIDHLLVKPAAMLVNLLTPYVGATASGQFLVAPGGGLQIVSACTGTEIYFLLTAALCVFPMTWRARIAGIGLGLAFVFVLNQARILALFYAHRSNLMLFDYLHGIFLPIGLVVSTSLFFLWWTASHASAAAPAQHADR
jgi:exosortase/archaeosortase family protein